MKKVKKPKGIVESQVKKTLDSVKGKIDKEVEKRKKESEKVDLVPFMNKLLKQKAQLLEQRAELAQKTKINAKSIEVITQGMLETMGKLTDDEKAKLSLSKIESRKINLSLGEIEDFCKGK